MGSTTKGITRHNALQPKMNVSLIQVGRGGVPGRSTVLMTKRVNIIQAANLREKCINPTISQKLFFYRHHSFKIPHIKFCFDRNLASLSTCGNFYVMVPCLLFEMGRDT